VHVYETVKYGKYASSKAMDAFEKTSAKVMIVHSEDDETVPIKYGYDKYYEKYSKDDRFVFKHYENRGHNNVFYSEEGSKYYNSLRNYIEQYMHSSNSVTQMDIVNYANKIIDRNKLSNLLDYELFEEIITLYNSCL
jgi:predicted Fe-Mo cluster-binding NifX family protein